MEEEDPSEMIQEFTKKSLFDMMKEFERKKMDQKLSLLEEKLVQITNCPEHSKSVLNRALRHFKSDFKIQWKNSQYKEDRFLRNNKKWLAASIKLPVWSPELGRKRQGRPSKDFQELSDCSKRRKTMQLRKKVSAEELKYAASVSQRAVGNSDASKMIKELTSSPTRATKLRKVITTVRNQEPIKKHTPEEALAIFVEGDFTKKQYEIIHGANKNIYPCYSLVKKAKKDCYPDEKFVRITETCSEIELQALLDHTASRLFKYEAEVINTCTPEEKKKLVLITKWGCDGSQQSQFKQKFQNCADSDANIFQSSLVPLRLSVFINGQERKIIWQNPVPSSVRFCRPIRIRFVHETKEITKEEIRYVESQVKKLKTTEILSQDGVVNIKHIMKFTMIDGKVCNAATDTASTMRCYICGQTSKDFNKLKEVKDINEEALQFGLSVLHARIRFFESILHLAYKLPLKKWQARSALEKKSVEETKKRIQREFREEMGLLVDIPKAGFGNTNDGNTSRRFFADADTSSRITGVNVDLIKKLRIILEVISSGHSIDTEKFAVYAQATSKMYVELYGWYPMSPTMHKVLMHGAKVIAHAILPIGQLSEEAAEARNKNFREYRQYYARTFTRIDCNKDIINRLLLSSDPYLSCKRGKQQKKSKPFSREAVSLMAEYTPLHQHDLSNEQSIDEYDDEDEKSE